MPKVKVFPDLAVCLDCWGGVLLLRNLNSDPFRRATSQEQADAKIAEARGPSAIL
jgi:hypothetical protein